MFAAFLLLLASGAADGAAATDTSQSPAKEKDPVVCETSQEMGSLLRKKRICHRRSEWRELRANDRQLIDRTQVQMPINTPG